MSATVETVLQLVRALCKAIASTSALTDTQVRLMDDPGPRSVPPYLGIRFQNSRGQGYDNTIATMGTTTVTYTGVGARMGSVSIPAILLLLLLCCCGKKKNGGPEQTGETQKSGFRP